jgi:flagella basal body P-ring formation protein FlgA
MQMLCLTKTDTYRRSRAWAKGWLCLLAAWSGMSLALADTASKTPLEDLQEQALRWVATQPAFQGKSMQIAPLDWRLRIQPCQQSLQFEQPFAGQASIKARCADPQWQMFLNLVQSNGQTDLNKTAAPATSNKQQVLVAKELLKRGTLINPSMFVKAEMPAPGMESQLLTDLKSLVNMELVRDLTPNTPLRSYDVKPAVLVKRGQEVIVTAGQGQGFQISLRAEALQDGGLGEQIRLKNSESGRSLSAVVTGPNEAKVR